jgi:hypothetical protein
VSPAKRVSDSENGHGSKCKGDVIDREIALRGFDRRPTPLSTLKFHLLRAQLDVLGSHNCVQGLQQLPNDGTLLSFHRCSSSTFPLSE